MSKFKSVDVNKKILLTGAAGFIGFHLAKRLLELGVSVIGFDNLNDYYGGCGQKPGLSIIPGGIACFPMKRELKPLTYSYSTI